MDHNGYRGTISTDYSDEPQNPLLGQEAFLDRSNGYISSRLDLSSLAGQAVRFRWRIGTDFTGGESNLGWVLDDIHLYTCSTTFNDVPADYWAIKWIEALYDAGITGGCSTDPLMYCPDATVTRGAMAVFLERGIHGSSFTPPDATPSFEDTAGHWAEDWIEALSGDGITAGCGAGNYCPDNGTTRAQMAIFLLRSKYGAGYTPPTATGTMFSDVPQSHWAASWIEQLAADGITAGCGGGNFCPDESITRAEMAVFLVRTFDIPIP